MSNNALLRLEPILFVARPASGRKASARPASSKSKPAAAPAPPASKPTPPAAAQPTPARRKSSTTSISSKSTRMTPIDTPEPGQKQKSKACVVM